MRNGCVYIMSNKWHGTLYVGVTAYLPQRVHQHRTGTGSSFVREHGLERLVWFDVHESISEAIAAEKRLKKWPRAWKIIMIEKVNPAW